MARNNQDIGGFGTTTLEEAYDPLFFAVRRVEKSLGGLVDAIPALRFPILQLTTVFRDFASVAITQQKNFLAFNKNFSDVLSSVGTKMEGLPGGLSKSLQSLFVFEKEGLTEVGKGTLNLANRMQITNQSMGALVKLNKKAIVQGTLSFAATEKLNIRLNTLGLRFNLSTDQLLEGITQMSDSFTVLGLTGGLGAAVDSIAGLTSKFPLFGEHIGKFVEALVTADIGTLKNLGILKDVDKLLAGQMTPAQLEQLIKKTSAGAGAFGNLRGGGLIETQVRMGIIGSVGVIGEQLARGLEEGRARTPSEVIEKVFDDFKTTLETTLLPVAVEIAKFATGFLTKAGEIVIAINEWKPIKTILSNFLKFMIAFKVFQVARQIQTRWAEIRFETGRKSLIAALWANTKSNLGGALSKAGGLAVLGGPVGIAMIAFALLPTLLESLSDSTETLANAEADRASAELAAVQRQDLARSNFEALTADLINSQIRLIEMGDSVLGLQMENFTDRVVAAVDGTTEAVDNSAPEPTVPRGELRPAPYPE